MAIRRCVPARTPLNSRNARQPDGGFLAVHKRDFNAHTSGQNDKHCADQINMNPPLSGPLEADDVQTTLELIETFIGGGAGGAFVTIGAGSTYGYATGDYNVGDTGITNLNDAFTAAFADTHLQDGGVVLLLAGDPGATTGGYTISTTVSVPSGIAIWGEPGGVIINSRTLNLPMFRILTADQEKRTSLGYESVSAQEALYSAQETKLWNLTLISNLHNEALYHLQGVPMISVDDGAVLKLDNVTCFGSIAAAAATADLVAVGSNALVSTTDPTIVDIDSCLFDGFSCGVIFSSNGGAPDHLTVKDCRIRYFGTNGTAANNYAINTTRCTANISGNWLYGVNDGTFGATGCINVKTDAVTDADVKFTIINNSGGLGSSASVTENSRFINTNSGTNTVRGFNSLGNSWGLANVGNFEITIGDGSLSVGDVTGQDALDIVLDRLSLIGNSKLESSVRLMPGTYYMTTTVTGYGHVNLFGPPPMPYSPTAQIVVTLGSTITDLFGRNTTRLGPRIENVTFIDNSSAARQNSITTTTNSISKLGLIKNVEFIMPVVVDDLTGRATANNSGTNAMTEFVSCRFRLNAKGTWPTDELAVYVNTDGTHVRFSSCQWAGWGYALHAAEEATTTSYNFRLSLHDCRFAPWEQTPTSGTTRIDTLFDDNSIADYKQRYIWINLDDKGDLDIENCQILGADILSGKYTPIVTTLIDPDASSKIAAFTEVSARKIRIDGCISEGPDQDYDTVTTLGYGLPSFYIVSKYQTTVSNSTFRGTQPLLIRADGSQYDKDSNELYEMTHQIIVENNVIQDYSRDPGWYSPNVFGVFTESVAATETDVSGTDDVIMPPTIVVRDNNIGHKKRTTHTALTSWRGFPAALVTGEFEGNILGGPCQIFVPGWSATVEGNTIYADVADADGTKGTAACAVWTVSQYATFSETQKWPSHSSIKDNTIYMRTRVISDTSNHKCVNLYVATERANISGNTLVFINDSATWSAGELGWMEIYVRTDVAGQVVSYIITDNIYHRVGEIPAGAHGIYMPTTVTNASFKGIFKNNLFTRNETSADLQDFVNVVPAGWIFERTEPNYTTPPAPTSSTTFDWETSIVREDI